MTPPGPEGEEAGAPRGRPAPRPPCRVEVATTVRQLDEAARVRFAVYRDAMALDARVLPSGREVNGYDVLETTRVLLARVGGEVAGTLRLAVPNPELAARFDGAIGLPLEEGAVVRSIPPGARPAELGRAAVSRAHRGTEAIGRLYAAAFHASRAMGVTHWLGFSLTATDSPDDVAMIAALLRRDGRCAAAPAMSPRQAVRPPAGRRPALYSPEQRRRAAAGCLDGIELPRAVAFHLATGARAIGDALFDAAFGEFMVPLVLSMDHFLASPFGRRWCSDV